MTTIEHEREQLNNRPRYVDIFTGLNLVSLSLPFKTGGFMG